MLWAHGIQLGVRVGSRAGGTGHDHVGHQGKARAAELTPKQACGASKLRSAGTPGREVLLGPQDCWEPQLCYGVHVPMVGHSQAASGHWLSEQH